jgi:RimJ/RimL family protein N-acetyltransferase
MHQEVKLKPLRLNDPDQVEFMFKVRTHAEVAKYLNGPMPESFLAHVNYLTNVTFKKYFYIVYCGEEMAGYCQMQIEKETVEIGWALHPSKMGIGIGAAAIQALLNICDIFTEKKVILYVKEDNVRAIKLYKKFNFIEKYNDNGILLMELKDAK